MTDEMKVENKILLINITLVVLVLYAIGLLFRLSFLIQSL